MTAKITMHTLAQNTTYAPSATLAITSDNPGGTRVDQASAGISLIAQPVAQSSQVQLFAAVTTHKPGEKPVNEPILTLSESSMEVSLHYDGSRLTIDFADSHRSVDLVTASPALSLACSTGDLWFTDVIVKPGA